MPSAIENLVKILKLEREQGAANRAVQGGLSAYSENWAQTAYDQARRPEQVRMIDEVASLLRTYNQLSSTDERLNLVGYMLDRLMNRVTPPGGAEPAKTETPRLPRQERPPRPEAETPAQPPAEKPRRADREASRRERANEGARHVQEGANPETRSERRAKQQSASGEPAADRPERPPRPERAPRPERSERPERAAPRSEQAQSPGVEPREPRRDRDRIAPGTNPRQGQSPSPRQNTPGGPRPTSGGPRRDRGDSFSESGDHNFDASDPIEATHTGRLDIPLEVRLARPPRQPRAALTPDAAADLMRGLNNSVSTIRGVGPHQTELLDKLGIQSIEDLLFTLPRRYDDYTRLLPIKRLNPEDDRPVTVVATVRQAELRMTRGSRKNLEVEFDDGTGTLSVTFFGQHYLQRTFQPGSQFVLHGKLSVFRHRLQMTNPEWEAIDPENLRTIGIVPVYPLTDGLGARAMRRLMKDAVGFWSERLPDYVPEAVLERTELADLGWALRNLHFPEGHDHLHHARTRYVFDQLLLLQLAVMRARHEWSQVPSIPLPVEDGFIEAFTEAAYPFPLTSAQRRAIEDVRRDIATTQPMNRLLQGDVGSGKTAVAATALAMTVAAGLQAAIMSPTGILAEQQYRSLSRVMSAFPGETKPRVALLTSSLTSADRKAVLDGLASGSINIVVGTHALIQETVSFDNLGLVVIDEQHRFGVEQRGILRGKGSNPHVLVMTATPIPRTLALTLFADLDLTVLDEMPPGRTPIKTSVVESIQRETMYRYVERELQKGRQAFVIHPLVEASESIEAASAVEAFEQLSKDFYKHRVGLLHGRMKPAEKDQIMADFAAGEIDLLVTTSVAEVGVDVPNATVIIIEGANRFGLAQLHQFRGRVGRGEHESACFLIPDALTPQSRERLRAMVETTDGFKLAEIDWKQRGAGDLVGTRQSGRNQLQLLEEWAPSLVMLAQREAQTLFAEDPTLTLPEHSLLAQRVRMLYDPDSDVS